LREDEAVAYRLLLRGAVYRQPVEESFYLAMGEEWGDDAAWQALELLQLRALVQETEEILLRQHNLIREVALEGLRDAQEWHWVQEQAAQIWLREYEAPAEASNLETVRGYLEAFYHYCQVEKWQQAWEVVTTELDTPTKEPLHDQLDTWGYYKEQLQIYTQMLGKLDQRSDCSLYRYLGYFYYFKADYEQAEKYFNDSLNLSKKIKDRRQEGKAMGGLGNCFYANRDYQNAKEYLQESWNIETEFQDPLSDYEATVILNLGNVFDALKERDKAISCYENALNIFEEKKSKRGMAHANNNFGSFYGDLEEYEKSMFHLTKALNLFQEIGDNRRAARVLGNLGELLIKLERYREAEENLQAALESSTDIVDPENQAHILKNFALLHQALGN
jgi:tetratricopeptide (TPR) repeat protein